MPEIYPSDDPEPDPYFDPVTFFAEHGDMEEVASHLKPGDSYRKAILGLDPVTEVVLRHELAGHGLQMVDAGSEWVFMAAGQSDDEDPAAARRRALKRGTSCALCGHRAGEHDEHGTSCGYRDFTGLACPCVRFTPETNSEGK
jgi:hypothetical protein